MRIKGLCLVFAFISLSAHAPSTLSTELSHSQSLSQKPFSTPEDRLITSEARSYAENLLKRWDAAGLSLTAVQRDTSQPSGWRHEFASFGTAKADGSPVTPDSVFPIASNSKLFLSISIGLLIHNESLTDLQGKRLTWRTKVKDIIPSWGLMDETAERGSTIQDLLSHRTGMPRHEFSYRPKDGPGRLDDMISNLRHLRPSAEFRETYQYNNMMYSTLSYLPTLLLNQTYPSYVSQHIFGPLNMTASTFSVAEAEERGFFADGFQYDLADIHSGKNGTKRPCVPFFLRPGDEEMMAGAGGVLSSARDLAMWVSMLLNEGRHPYTNTTVVPKEVIEHVAHGRSVIDGGQPPFPELGPKVYGAGQMRSSYQGREIVEHGGSVPGFKSQIARFPKDKLAVISMSNDENGSLLIESVKWRVVDDVLGLEKIDWNKRYETLWSTYLKNAQKHTPRPKHPDIPKASLISLANHSFTHPTYGTLKPCLVPGSAPSLQAAHDLLIVPGHPHCASFLASPPTRRLLSDTDLSSPTFLIPFDRGFATHLLLSHFDGTIFNLTAVWTNWGVRDEFRRSQRGPTIRIGRRSSRDTDSEGDSERDQDSEDLITRWPEIFEVEWVNDGDSEQGLAFRGGFWGREGPDSRDPEGTGKEGAEVWFGKVED